MNESINIFIVQNTQYDQYKIHLSTCSTSLLHNNYTKCYNIYRKYYEPPHLPKSSKGSFIQTFPQQEGPVNFYWTHSAGVPLNKIPFLSGFKILSLKPDRTRVLRANLPKRQTTLGTVAKHAVATAPSLIRTQ